MKKHHSLLQALLLVLAFSSKLTKAQEKPFEDFKEYTNYGISFSPMLYNKSETTSFSYGNRDIYHKPTFSGKIGAVYVFNPQNPLSFRTGLFLEKLPLYNHEFELYSEDFPEGEEIGAGIYGEKKKGQLRLNVPILAEYKYRLSPRFIFNINAGAEFMFLRKGGFENISAWEYTDEMVSEKFGIYGNTQGGIYPSLRLSPGIYYKSKYLLIQTNLVYKKSLKNYYEGEFQYNNLENASPSRGDYKLSGDYIGLEVSLFFKKSRKK